MKYQNMHSLEYKDEPSYYKRTRVKIKAECLKKW